MAESVIIEFGGSAEGLKPIVEALKSILNLSEEQEAVFNKTFNAVATGAKVATTEVGKLSAAIKNSTEGIIGGGLEEAMKRMSAIPLVKQLQDLKKAGKENTDEFKKLAEQVLIADRAFNGTQSKIVNVIQKSASLVTQLRALQNQLAQLEPGTKEFTKLGIEAAKVRDKIDASHRAVRILASDSRGLDTLVAAATGIAGAFSVAQGAAALLGDENEDLQKSLLKVQASLAILNGLQAVSDTLNKKNILSTNLSAAAIGVYDFVVKAATATQRAFNLLLVAGVGGAIIAGIALLVANWEKLSVAIGLSKSQAEKFRDIQTKGATTYADEATKVGLLVKQYESANTSQKRRSEIIKELKEISPGYFGQLDIESKKVGVDLVDAYTKYANALILKGKIEAFTQKISENNVKLFEEENKKVGENISNIEALFRFYTGIGGTAEASLTKTKVATGKLKDDNKLLTDEVIRLSQELTTLGGDPSNKAVEGLKRIKEETEFLKKDGLVPIDKVLDFSKISEEQATEDAKKVKDYIDNIERILKGEKIELDVQTNLPGVNADTSQEKEELDREKEKQDTIRDLAIDSAREVSSAIFEIGSQRRADELNDELSKLDSERDKALSNKNLTESQKAAIDEKFRKMEFKLRAQAFEAEKKAKISQILVNAALASVTLLSTTPPTIGVIPNPAYIASQALILLTTGLSIANVARQKFPGFKTGTKSAPGGLALVGEQGSELVESHGQLTLVKSPSLVNLPKFSKVIPHPATMALLENSAAAVSIVKHYDLPVQKRSDLDYGKLAKAIGAELKDMPRVHVEVDGVSAKVKILDGMNEREYLNRRHSIG